MSGGNISKFPKNSNSAVRELKHPNYSNYIHIENNAIYNPRKQLFSNGKDICFMKNEVTGLKSSNLVNLGKNLNINLFGPKSDRVQDVGSLLIPASNSVA